MLSLSSLSHELTSQGSQVSTECSTLTTTSIGTQTNFYLGSLDEYQGTGCFSMGSKETYQFTETRTYDVAHRARDSGSQGSLSLSTMEYQALGTQQVG